MLFHADLGSRQKSMGDGEQSRLTIAMTAPIDRNGFQAKIEGSQMRSGGQAGLTQQ